MNILIACDKFKGSLTSKEVGEALRTGLLQVDGSHQITIYPMADGGDGFDEVVGYYYPLEKRRSEVVDALRRPVVAEWQWDPTRKTAYIAVASATALAQLKKEERNPEKTSSYGTGLLIKEAINAGAKTIVLGLGGSATHDAGTGILAALGFRFLDKNGEGLDPCGGILGIIDRIIPPVKIADVEFNIASDVDNPLIGEHGAAAVYAPQKGADAAMVKRLEEGTRHFATLLSEFCGKDISQVPGLGAAGGIAAGLVPFFRANIHSGIDLVVGASGILNDLPKADLLITGEGKLDNQSTRGKLVGRMAGLAKLHSVKCVAVCGISELNEAESRAAGLDRVLSIRDLAKSEEESISNAADLLQQVAKDII